ncbi:4535_t:CDS:2 [Cetraspora pellucida]|uniref:4535_t:CDS:1 n=1 Tax=Cetraspora pellucida TaxID=1433469 RepID=A0A9N9DWR7_9GLOM|nr:4535_t:CDS:2 [Cetraspora pellucida]
MLDEPNTELPANLTVPSGNCFQFLLYGSGVQQYQCLINNGTPQWSQVGPDAYLINDIKKESFTSKYEVAHHYFQPTPVNGGRITWQSIVKKDDSLVIAKIIASSPSPNGSGNVPWLQTQATSNQGNGRFSNITYVLRINTKGGVAPSVDQCGSTYQNSQTAAINYTTEYWYFSTCT